MSKIFDSAIGAVRDRTAQEEAEYAELNTPPTAEQLAMEARREDVLRLIDGGTYELPEELQIQYETVGQILEEIVPSIFAILM